MAICGTVSALAEFECVPNKFLIQAEDPQKVTGFATGFAAHRLTNRRHACMRAPCAFNSFSLRARERALVSVSQCLELRLTEPKMKIKGMSDGTLTQLSELSPTYPDNEIEVASDIRVPK